MNWRSIRIHTDGDDVAIVPNGVVAKSDIVNRSFPTRVRSAFIELSCPATSKPERVIDTLQEATLLCPTILSVPLSSAVLTRLGSTENRYPVSYTHLDVYKRQISCLGSLSLRLGHRNDGGEAVILLGNGGILSGKSSTQGILRGTDLPPRCA